MMFVEVDAGVSCTHAMIDLCPCIAKSCGAGGGYLPRGLAVEGLLAPAATITIYPVTCATATPMYFATCIIAVAIYPTTCATQGSAPPAVNASHKYR